MSNISHTAAVVLAGGQSRRMGQDKAQLKLGDKTLLQLAVHIAHHAGCQPVLINRNDEHHLADIFPGQGPLAGIHAAMQTLQTQRSDTTWLLVLAIDMPLLQNDSLQQLLATAQREQQACYFAEQFLPCVIPLNPDTGTTLQTLLQNQQLALQDFLQHIGAKPLPLPDQQQFLGCNTPEEWQQVKQHFTQTHRL